MGRFGNQAEQLLGSLYFAKSINRTLVLPPFIYHGPQHTPKLIPFDDVIQVEPLKGYHDVILAKDFMDNIAPKMWPPNERKFYCYNVRDFVSNSCALLNGQPFETFWTSFNVTNYQSIFYKPLTTSARDAKHWSLEYPIDLYPVLAFVGAPSSFPADQSSIQAQKFIHLSYKVQFEAEMFKLTHGFANQPYISMHIRHGIDWTRACEKLQTSEMSQFFSSNQCTGYNVTTRSPLGHETCLPSFENIAYTLEETLRTHKRSLVSSIVHIATDFNDIKLWDKFKTRFPQIQFVMNPKAFDDMMGAMIDIYLMTNADLFIGNCISSFSAFPARIRSEQLDLKHRTSYIGYSYGLIPSESHKNDEL